MGFVGGDFINAKYQHPTLGSGVITFKANESATIEPGGFRNADDDNNVTGDGRMLIIKNRRLATVEFPPVAWDMTDTEEQQKLADLAESNVLADWVMTHVSGAIWGGRGIPVGDIPGDTGADTITLKVGFEGKLEKL